MQYFTDEEQKKIIAENLAYYITQSGKDQKTVALDLNVQPPTFNTWVKGKALPPVSQLQRIAAYFNLLISDIIDPRAEIPQDRQLMRYYNGLNEEGKKDLVRYARIMFQSGEYSQVEWRRKNGKSD